MINLSARDGLFNLQCFVKSNEDVNSITLDYSQRRKYEEKLMYYYMGVSIASLDVKWLPFYKKNVGLTYKALSSNLGKEILVLLEHASGSRALGWDEEYALLLKYSPIMEITYDAFVAATMPGGEDVAGVGFIECVNEFKKRYSTACGKRADISVDGLNKFVLQLKEALNKNKLREDVKNYYRNSQNCYFQLMQVATQAWEVNCKNVLLRIDWGFKKENPPMPPRLKTEAEIAIDFAKVDVMRKKMLKRLQKMYGNVLSFYAWKVECGYDKGLHIHWLIAINGSKHQNAWYIAKEIADDWNNHVCDENSYAWNVCDLCNEGSKYLRNLDYRDPDLSNILQTYARYLTKLDVTMKLRAPDGYRSFGCSKLKKLNKKKPGPARTVVNSLKGWVR